MKKTAVKKVGYLTESEEKWLRREIRKMLLSSGYVNGGKINESKRTPANAKLAKVIDEVVGEVLQENNSTLKEAAKIEKGRGSYVAGHAAKQHLPYPKQRIRKVNPNKIGKVEKSNEMAHKTNPSNTWNSKDYIKGDENWIQHGKKAKPEGHAKHIMQHSENDDFKFGTNGFKGKESKWYKTKKGKRSVK